MCFVDLESNTDKPTPRTQTLANCINRKVSVWAKQSVEYTLRLCDVQDILIQTGLPVTFVDNPAVRKAYQRLDPKFVLPGM